MAGRPRLGWAEAMLAGALAYLALAPVAGRFAGHGEIEPDPRRGSDAAGG
jgi:hypothetical protein